MTKHRFISSEMRAGVWHGACTGSAESLQIQVTCQGKPLDNVTCDFDHARNVWDVKVPVPPALIEEGVQTFVVTDANGETLTHFFVQSGGTLTEELRAEVSLLRAELDILKAAFRRHCAEK